MKKNKLKILLFYSFIVVFGCKNELYNNDRFIQNLSNDIDFEIPMVNESLMIFIKKKDSVYVTSLRQLYFLKEKKYMNIKDFDSFLVDAINGDILLGKEISENSSFSFSLDKSILNEYKHNGTEYLLNTYCEKAKTGNKFYIKAGLDLILKYTIMYILFKNNYYIMHEDYNGKYVLIDKNL